MTWSLQLEEDLFLQLESPNKSTLSDLRESLLWLLGHSSSQIWNGIIRDGHLIIGNWHSFHFTLLCVVRCQRSLYISSIMMMIIIILLFLNASISISVLKYYFVLFHFSIITDISISLQSKCEETCLCLDWTLNLANLLLPSKCQN